MRLQNMLWLALVLLIPGNVWAYGDNSSGSSGTGSCKKVNFSEFSPTNHAEVAPESDFSFYASPSTYPKSIKVTIKGQSVPVTVVEKQGKGGFVVSGKIPESVRGTFAKINIEARGVNQCEVTGGWLVKVTESVSARASSDSSIESSDSSVESSPSPEVEGDDHGPEAH